MHAMTTAKKKLAALTTEITGWATSRKKGAEMSSESVEREKGKKRERISEREIIELQSCKSLLLNRQSDSVIRKES